MNWRGKPLVSLETIINLIAATTTSTGLKVYARLDDGTYPDKISVPDTEIKAVNLHGDTVPSRMELHHQTGAPLISYNPLAQWQFCLYDGLNPSGFHAGCLV